MSGVSGWLDMIERQLAARKAALFSSFVDGYWIFGNSDINPNTRLEQRYDEWWKLANQAAIQGESDVVRFRAICGSVALQWRRQQHTLLAGSVQPRQLRWYEHKSGVLLRRLSGTDGPTETAGMDRMTMVLRVEGVIRKFPVLVGAPASGRQSQPRYGVRSRSLWKMPLSRPPIYRRFESGRDLPGRRIHDYTFGG